METTRTEELLAHLADVVDCPLYDRSDRVLLSRTLAIASLDFAASVRHLCGFQLLHGAATVLRSQFEAVVRGIWELYPASDHQVQKLSSDLSVEFEEPAKNIPQVAEMLSELERFPLLDNVLIALHAFKKRLLATAELVRPRGHPCDPLDEIRTVVGTARQSLPRQQIARDPGVPAACRLDEKAGLQIPTRGGHWAK